MPVAKKNLESNLSITICINKINFSDDAIEIMNISVLTNAYYPKINISDKLKIIPVFFVRETNQLKPELGFSINTKFSY